MSQRWYHNLSSCSLPADGWPQPRLHLYRGRWGIEGFRGAQTWRSEDPTEAMWFHLGKREDISNPYCRHADTSSRLRDKRNWQWAARQSIITVSSVQSYSKVRTYTKLARSWPRQNQIDRIVNKYWWEPGTKSAQTCQWLDINATLMWPT